MGLFNNHDLSKEQKNKLKQNKQQKKSEEKAKLKQEKANFKPLKQEFLLNGAQDYQGAYIDFNNKKILLLDNKAKAAVSKDFSAIKYYKSNRVALNSGIKSNKTYMSAQNTANISFTIGFFDDDVRIITIYSNLVQQKKMEHFASEIENTLRNIVEENNSLKENTEKDDLSQLTKLKQLADSGVITEDEFEAKKKQILGI